MPNPPTTGTFVAFDFGLKKIGVAVGDAESKNAEALCIIPAQKGFPNWKDVDTVIANWRPKALVVGVPLNMDGSAGRMAVKARGFIKVLREHTDIEVYEADERLSTIEARTQIFEQGGSKALRSGPVDAHAARVILEMWMVQTLAQD